MRQCEDKGISYPQEYPHPQRGEGEGGQDGYVTLGEGGVAFPNLDHIACNIFLFTLDFYPF